MWREIINYFIKKRDEFIWGDSWWIDDHEVWIMSGDMNILFNMKVNSFEATYVSKIPAKEIFGFRQYPRCIKNGNTIFCFPDKGEDIWCYHLSDFSWSKICIENPNKVRLLCSNIWIVKDKLYIVSKGLKKIIELNIDKQSIEGCYDLPVKELSDSILVGKEIYIVAPRETCICKFNCLEKITKIYPLSEIDDSIKTICFDGEKFWMSGKKKKIYIWNENIKKTSIIEDFPKSFGVYNFSGQYQQLLNCKENIYNPFLFLYSVDTKKYIWFIPFQANEILYIDKSTFKIEKFPIEHEEQTEKNIKDQFLNHKYLLQYVKESRYLGIFSLKNKWIIEIDSEKLKYKILKYKVSKESLFKALASSFIQNKLLFEQQKSDLEYFANSLSYISLNEEKFLEEKRSFYGKNIFLHLNP